MKNFVNVIKEINKTLNFLSIFDILINTTIFFLVVYLLLSLINLFPILAIIPATVYFLARFYLNSKTDKRLLIESKYSPLKEKLRTAADNFDKENPVVNELEEEVVSELKNVGLSSFIETKKVTYKILLTIILSFAIVFATTQNLYVVDLNKFFSNFQGFLENANPGKKGSNTLLGEINESDDIYGASKLAVLGDNQIDIKIKPQNYEVNVREEGDAEDKQFDEIFPNEIAVEQASAFEEKIPEEQQALVKSYFNKLAEG
jgi:hypothetical protein